MQTSPFKFLDAYNKEDRDIFFGREEEVESLYNLLLGNKLVLVYGQSGTGKSSLIACGLANRIEETDWYAIPIRRKDNLINSIKKQLATHADTPLKENSSLIKSVQSLYLDHFKPIHLIFDQFEELFILGNKAEQSEFIDFVKEILASDLQCKIILSMREEYIAQLYDFEQEVPSLLSQGLRIAQMSRKGLEEVIRGSTEKFNIKLEEGDETIAHIIGKIGEKKSRGVQLPYLQVYLDRLFQEAIQQKKGEDQHVIFGQDLIEEVGELENVLETFIEEQVERVSTRLEKPENGWQLLKLLVTDEGTKKITSLTTIYQLAEIRGLTKEEVTLGLNEFERCRILRRVENSVEVAHDILALQIFSRVTAEEKNLFRVERIIRGRFEEFTLTKRYLSSNELNYLSPYLGQLVLSNETKDFVEKSRLRLKRRRQRILLFIAILFLGISGFGVYNYLELQDQKLETERAILQVLETEKELGQQANATTAKAKQLFEALNRDSELFKQLKNAVQKNDFATIRKIISKDLRFTLDSRNYDAVGTLINGRALVRQDDIYGYVNLDGKLVIPLSFEEASDFENGTAEVSRYGIKFRIDTLGDCIENCDLLKQKIEETRAALMEKYDEVLDLSEGFIGVRKGDKWGYVDAYGNPAIQLKYDDAQSFKNGKALVGIEKDYLLINRNGECIENCEAFVILPNKVVPKDEPEETNAVPQFTWEITSLEQVEEFVHGEPIRGTVVSPNQLLLLTVAGENSIIWEMNGTKTALNRTPPSSNYVESSIFSPDARKIFFPTFKSWELTALKGQLRTLKKGGEGRNTRFGFFSNDGKYIAYSDSTGKVGLLEGTSGDLLRVKLNGHSHEIRDARFMANKYLATMSIDGEAVLWDRATLKERLNLSWLALADLQASAKETDSQFQELVRTIEKNTLKVDEIQSNPLFDELYRFLYGYREPSRVSRNFDMYKRQRKLNRDITAIKNTQLGRDKLPTLYQGLSKEEFEKTLEKEYTLFKKLKYSIRSSIEFDLMENGEAESFIEFAHYLQNFREYEQYQKFKEFLTLFKLARNDISKPSARNDFFFSDVQIRISPDGKFLLASYGKITTASGNEGIQTMIRTLMSQMQRLLAEDKKSNFPTFRFLTNPDIQGNLQLLFNSKALLPGHELWDIRGNFKTHYSISNSSIALAEFSPTQSKFLGISSTNEASLWNLDGKKLAKFEGHEGAITDLEFSPDGEIVFTVATDSTAKLWDTSGRLLQTIDAHSQRVTHVNILPATKKGQADKFITSSEDGKAILWQMRRKKVKIEPTQ